MKNIIIDMISGRKFIPFYKDLAKCIGRNEAIIFSELCSTASYLETIEFCESNEQIMENTISSEWEVRTVLKNLRDLGIISTELKGIPAKRCITINIDVVERILSDASSVSSNVIVACQTPDSNILSNESSNSNELDNPLSNNINNKTELNKRESAETQLNTEVSNTLEEEKSIKVRILDTKENVIEVINKQEDLQAESLFDIYNRDIESQASRLAQTMNSAGTIERELFDYWNTKKLRKHKAFQSHYTKNLDSVLKETTIDKLKQAIDNYAEIVNCEKCFWTYVWDLQDFIDPKRKLYERFLDGGDVWENNKKTLESERKFIETFYHDPEHRDMYIKEQTDASFDMNKELKESDSRRREEALARKNDPNKIVL